MTQDTAKFTGAKNEVKLITLDPGHFHAALVQKTMYETVNPVVYVYAPEGPDVVEHLARITGFNNRPESPTAWIEKIYTGTDFLEKMVEEKKGNVVIISGNNARKAEYIMESVKTGFNVLADKPMIINPEEFPVLEEAYRIAEEKNLLLYDIMTERFEITSLLQREFSMITEVFGELLPGSLEEPAITKESVHHFFKYVSGKPLIRPAWFFDVEQQGEGIADVTTHLVDLIQWEAFPEIILAKPDVEMLRAKRWTTDLSLEQFTKVTGLDAFPEFLNKYLDEGKLKVYSNGEMNYTLKGINAKVSVIWNFQAPEGTGDTHYSIMRGTNCSLIIRQGAEEGYKPRLYIENGEAVESKSFEGNLQEAIKSHVSAKYPGVTLRRIDNNSWTIDVPESYNVGHEAHFGQVTEKFLEYLKKGSLPEWEIPNIIAKYYTTTRALELANK